MKVNVAHLPSRRALFGNVIKCASGELWHWAFPQDEKQPSRTLPIWISLRSAPSSGQMYVIQDFTSVSYTRASC